MKKWKREFTINLDNPKRWNFISFESCDSTITSLCMAILHGNAEYVNKFIAFLVDRQYSSSSKFNACLAASVADNVDLLNKCLFGCDSNLVLKYSDKLLHIICEWGSKNAAEYLITNGKCDLNSTNNFGETPLHIACRHERIEVVQLLLNTGQCNKFDIPNLSGETLLHLACLHSNIAIANLILDIAKKPVDIQDNYGDTPLMNACYVGNVNLIERLVDMGYDPLCVNEVSKNTPFHIACTMQRLDILKKLVKNISTKVDHRNIFGESPLCIALKGYCMDIVQFFVQKELCDVSLPLHTHTGSSNEDNAVKLFHYKVGNCTGDNALHFACETDDHKLLQLLLKYSSNSITVTNDFGDTPLHISARNGSVDVLKFLIANYNGPLDCLLNQEGNSVLHLACERGSLKSVQLLVESCSVTLKNDSGNTPIHIACRNRSDVLVRCLLKKCSGNLDHHRNNNNDTILHLAAEVGDLHTIKCLLKHCSTNCQNSDGDTPIHIACRSNNQPVVECLLKKNNSTDLIENIESQTYLHAACNKNAQLSVVKTLFKKGYRTLGNCPDKKGDIPLHYACRYGHIKIIEYLMTDNRCDSYRFNNNGLSPLYSTFLCHRGIEIIKFVIRKRLCDFNHPIKRDGLRLLHCLIQIRDPFERFFTDCASEDDEVSLTGVIDMDFSSLDVLNIVKMLTKLDSETIELNATDCKGNTALHLACSLRRRDIVMVLLSSNAVGQSISHRNHNGKSPIQLTNNYDIIRLLMSYGANPEDVYDRFASILEKSKEEQPLESAVKIVVLGNATAGKTTLVEVLKSDKEDVLKVKGSTAGIETSKAWKKNILVSQARPRQNLMVLPFFFF